MKKIKDKKMLLDRYEILQELGRGGMGVVYKAYDPIAQRNVALKVILDSSKAENKKRFESEARITALLKHPNIVEIYEFVSTGNQDFFVMQFIEGTTLAKKIQDAGIKSATADKKIGRKLSALHCLVSLDKTWLEQEILPVMIKVGRAIEYAHSQGVIHRDLKPANIMIDPRGEPKVMDFGLAKLLPENIRLSQSGNPIGTLGYMPPEQAEGIYQEIDYRSDVYALGATLYDLLTGRPPFMGSVPLKIMEAIIHKDPEPPSSLKRGIDGDLDSICLKALEKNKADRYQSAGDFVADLVRLQKGESIKARPLALKPRIVKKLRRHRKILIISACLLALIGMIAAVKGYFQELRHRQEIEQAVIAAENSLEIMKKKVGDWEIRYREEKVSDRETGEQQKARKQFLQEYRQIRSSLTLLAARDIANPRLRKLLFRVEKETGLLALSGDDYVIPRLAFERCKNLGDKADAEKLLQRIDKKRREAEEQQLARIGEIMNEMSSQPPQEGMSGEYVTEIVRMRGSHVLGKLAEYLRKGNHWQRYVAIEALGKLGDNFTKITSPDASINQKDAVELLMARLEELAGDSLQKNLDEAEALMEELAGDSLQKNLDEAEALIWALGRLRDGRASALVENIRWEAGQNSNFAEKTRLPYSWIPFQEEKTGKTEDKVKRLLNRGLTKFQKGDTAGAIQDFNEVLALDPRSYAAYLNRGNARMSLGDESGSMEDYNQTIQLNPECADAYHNRGQLWKNLGDSLIHTNGKEARIRFNKAIQDYSEAIRINSSYYSAYNKRGIARQMLGDFDGAIQDYREVIRLNPQDANAYNNLGMACHAQKDLNEAILNYTEAIRLDPQDTIAYMNRGAAYYEKGAFDKAIVDYNDAIRINPRDASAYQNRANAKARKREYDGALQDYGQAIRLDPTLAIVYPARARVFIETGKIGQAVEDYRKYLQLCPDAPEAQSIRNYIEQQSNKK